MANIYVSSVDGSDADSGATWALAKATLTGALAIATNADTIWLDPAHAESTASAVTLTCPASQGLRILSADSKASEPPTGLSATASVSVGAASAALTIRGFAYVYGVIFQGGTNGSASGVLALADTTAPAALIFDSCQFISRTGVACNNSVGPVGQSSLDDSYVRWINCKIKTAATGTLWSAQACYWHISGMSFVDATGSTPTTLFRFLAGTNNNTLLEASDLSAENITNLWDVARACPSRAMVRNCKLPASIAITTGTNPGLGGPIVRVHNCDSGSTNYRIAEASFAGSVVSETAVTNDAGADDGSGQAFSWAMTTNANALFPYALLESPEIVKWNSTTGSSKTVTVEIVHDGATAFKDNEVWLEVQYLSDSGTPLGAFVSDRMTNVLSTAQTQATSTATWTGDTGTGPNGSTTWNTLKLGCSFTPQKIGYIQAKVMMAIPSKTVYVDPLLTIA